MQTEKRNFQGQKGGERIRKKNGKLVSEKYQVKKKLEHAIRGCVRSVDHLIISPHQRARMR